MTEGNMETQGGTPGAVPQPGTPTSGTTPAPSAISAEMLNALAETFITVDGEPKAGHQKKMMREVLRRRSLPKLACDGWSVLRAFM